MGLQRFGAFETGGMKFESLKEEEKKRDGIFFQCGSSEWTSMIIYALEVCV